MNGEAEKRMEELKKGLEINRMNGEAVDLNRRTEKRTEKW